MTEQWKPIKENPEYQVSSYGRVLGKRGYLKGGYNMDGRHLVSIQGKSYQVHRLVAEAFIPNPNNYAQVHHRDKDYTNNNVENLEWTDMKEHCKKHLGDKKAKRNSKTLTSQEQRRKEMKKKANHERYMKKREEMLEYSKRYYQDNIDGAREKRKQRWRETHNWQGHIYKK